MEEYWIKEKGKWCQLILADGNKVFQDGLLTVMSPADMRTRMARAEIIETGAEARARLGMI
jgi:hypothetical protein